MDRQISPLVHLRIRHQIFANHFLLNLNQTRAYLAAYPGCKSPEAAQVAGCRLMRRPEVQRYIAWVRARVQAGGILKATIVQWPRGRRPKLKENHALFIRGIVAENKKPAEAYCTAFPQCSPRSAPAAACRLLKAPSIRRALEWAQCSGERERQRIEERDYRRERAKWERGAAQRERDRRREFDEWVERQIFAAKLRKAQRARARVA